jgi:hypothetical protein
MTKAAAPAPLPSERARFAKMDIRQLHGMIGRNREHLRDNVRNGVYKTRPGTLDGLLYALQTRQAELDAFRIEWAQRPRAVFEANAAKRSEEEGPNGETSATHDFVTEKHKTGGKGQMVSAGTWVKRQSSSAFAC